MGFEDQRGMIRLQSRQEHDRELQFSPLERADENASNCVRQ